MSQTIEIPKDKWGEYLDALGNRMKDRPVEIELEQKDGSRKRLADRMPLVGLSLDPKGSGHCELEMTVESRADGENNFEHVFHEPAHLYAETDDEGKVECLDIEDDDGRTHVVF